MPAVLRGLLSRPCLPGPAVLDLRVAFLLVSSQGFQGVIYNTQGATSLNLFLKLSLFRFFSYFIALIRQFHLPLSRKIALPRLQGSHFFNTGLRFLF